MMDEHELRGWLRENYPMLRLRSMPDGGWGIWQVDKRYERYDITKFSRPETLTPARSALEAAGIVFEDEIDTIILSRHGYSIVFPIQNRIIGGWVKDEVTKRDPRLFTNEGNVFFEAYRNSLAVSDDTAKRQKKKAESGLEMWKGVRKNEALMNRIAKKMARGDLNGASRELSLENLAYNAYIENPHEMKNPDFKRAVIGDML